MPDVFISNAKSPGKHPVQAIDSDKQSQKVQILTTFCENPNGAHFQTQESDESILLFLRAHFLTNLPWILTTLFLLLLPLFIPLLLTAITLPDDLISKQFLTITTLFYYCGVFTYSFINFITWYYNIGLVTQIRVIDIDFSNLVYHDVAQTKLNLVEDVNYTQSGFIRTFLNYGDIFIQTAGGKENIEFLSVPQPGKAVKIISDLIGKGEHSG